MLKPSQDPHPAARVAACRGATAVTDSRPGLPGMSTARPGPGAVSQGRRRVRRYDPGRLVPDDMAAVPAGAGVLLL